MKKPEKNEADGKGGPSKKKKSNQIEVKEKERKKEGKRRKKEAIARYCAYFRALPAWFGACC